MKDLSLAKKHCKPCEGHEKPLDQEDIARHLSMLKTSWAVIDDREIEKKFKFKDFKEAMVFINKVAEIAESEGHHPEIEINYNKVEIELTTHAIGGLSMNDFIIAAKIEAIMS